MIVPASEPSTTPVPVDGTSQVSSSRLVAAGGAVALLCLAAVLLEATADLLPDDPVVGVLTPVRLVLGIGLVGAAVGGVGLRRWRTPLDPAIAALLLAAAAATVVAGQPWAAWRGVLTAAATYYLVVGVRRAMPGSESAFGLLALVGVAVAGSVAARQAAAGTSTGFCRGALDGSADVCGPDAVIRAVGTFSNPNLLAAFLVLLLPVAAAGAARLADHASRLLAAGIVVVGYAAVLLTASRGGALAAVAGVVVFVVVRRSVSNGDGARRRRTGTGVALLLGVVCSAVAAGTALLLLAPDGLVGVRAEVWTAAVRLTAEHPLGVGPGRAGALLDAAIPGDEAFQHAHDLWLNWAVETGVPGLVAVLALTVGTAIGIVRATRAGSAMAAAAGAGLAGFAVMSVADHPGNAIRVSIALWAVLALVAAEVPVRTRRRWRPGQPATRVRSRSGSR
ncbi:O-antigen ligase family protein [Pseudonocardia xinjiangensis]|uniref:O-antigen ligase family protein n=1 Tax=Pseudonocardia xinjiangensis TaxID=75289 RepID=UPI003D8DC37D